MFIQGMMPYLSHNMANLNKSINIIIHIKQMAFVTQSEVDEYLVFIKFYFLAYVWIPYWKHFENLFWCCFSRDLWSVRTGIYDVVYNKWASSIVACVVGVPHSCWEEIVFHQMNLVYIQMLRSQVRQQVEKHGLRK